MQIRWALHWGSELKCFESFNLCQWHSLFQGILIHHRIPLSACLFFTYAVFVVRLFQRCLKLFPLLCLLFVLFEDLLHGYKSWHWMSRKLGSSFDGCPIRRNLHYSFELTRFKSFNLCQCTPFSKELLTEHCSVIASQHSWSSCLFFWPVSNTTSVSL